MILPDDHTADSYRDAIALAQAANRRDPHAFAAIWNGTTDPRTTLELLAALPAIVADAIAARLGVTIDAGQLLASIALDAADRAPWER